MAALSLKKFTPKFINFEKTFGLNNSINSWEKFWQHVTFEIYFFILKN